MFRIRLLQLQRHGRDRLRLSALHQSELIILAIAFVFKCFKVASGIGDESSLHAQVPIVFAVAQLSTQEMPWWQPRHF